MNVAEKAKKELNQKDKKVSVPDTMLGLKSTQVQNIFAMYRSQIAQAIPRHLTAERIIQTATTLISRTPELAECTTESLIGAVMQASILGFQPVPALGHCYFIPFRNGKSGKREVQFIIGYMGFLDLARRSNQIETIYSQAVYENDLFEYEFGLNPKLVHKPAIGERGKITHAYTVSKFLNGGYAFEVMSVNDILKIKKRSAAGESKYSPWNNPDDFPEMCKKTVVRRLSKYLPLSLDIQKTIQTDGAVLTARSFEQTGEVDLNKIEYAQAIMSADDISKIKKRSVVEVVEDESEIEPLPEDDRVTGKEIEAIRKRARELKTLMEAKGLMSIPDFCKHFEIFQLSAEYVTKEKYKEIINFFSELTGEQEIPGIGDENAQPPEEQ